MNSNFVFYIRYFLCFLIIHDINALTTVLTFNFFKCVYFYPTPTNNIGFPVADVNDNAAPTFSSTVSNLLNIIASISLILSFGLFTINALLKLIN